MNIITLPANSIDLVILAEAVTRATAQGSDLHVSVDSNGVKYKIGGGMWSADLGSQYIG